MSHLFSPHQIDVLDLVSEGLKNKEIARCLSMSENMIKNDLRRIFDLAGCDTRVEVVVWWRNHRRCGEGTVNSKRDGNSPCFAPQISVGIQHATTCALEAAMAYHR
jgi:DNA-binding CsgD family transcriptional regulator